MWIPISCQRPGRVGGGEDALERDPCQFGDAADAVRGPLELAEDDLVFAQQNRAEVPNRAIRAEFGDHLVDAPVERGEFGIVDVGPVALGDEALPFPLHDDRR